MDSNNIIQGLWIGGSLSTMEQLSIKSFLSNGHQYHLYVYGDVKNIPEGTIVLDGNSIVPENQIFTYKTGFFKDSYSGFADLFRMEMLHKLGGWWADLDVICLKPFDFEQETVIASSYEYKWGILPNNNVLKFPANSSFTERALNQIRNTNPETMQGLEMGPHLVQRLAKEDNFNSFVVPFHYFNPITPANVRYHLLGQRDSFLQTIKEFLRPVLKPSSTIGTKILPGSYSVHLWNEHWKNWSLSKDQVFPTDSLIEKLKEKYQQ